MPNRWPSPAPRHCSSHPGRLVSFQTQSHRKVYGLVQDCKLQKGAMCLQGLQMVSVRKRLPDNFDCASLHMRQLWGLLPQVSSESLQAMAYGLATAEV